MYVHLGDDVSISDRYIVGIFDLDNLTAYDRGTNRAFLGRLQESSGFTEIGGNLPLSLVLSLDATYLSPLSSRVLAARVRQGQGPRKQAKAGEE